MKGFFGLLSLVAALAIIGWLAMNGFKDFSGDKGKNLMGAKQRTERVAVKANLSILNSFVNQYRSMYPGEPVTMDALKAAGIKLPECPPGGRFELEDGRIVYKGPEGQ
ncbi:MAG: hypothetical protein CO090_07795 [Acidobacteria bacterium CG_4_9_14_3_um_filter_49_7]|nr:MAG: hypothetical protein CO090_07795 [Acidobacteria bacterium CG_4_9_14_3_um_filter_49_7]